MGASQRRKGQSGERELFALLSEELGTIVRRNVDQARAGGADGLEIPGWAIEVKRQETRSWLPAWWVQAHDQAFALGRHPILFYRASRQPWRAVVGLDLLAPTIFAGKASVAEIGFKAACLLIRESLK